MFYVYILKCNDGSFYTGHTEVLDRRLAQHDQAYFNNCYTAKRLPVVLVYQGEFDTRERALIVERQVKGWSRKKKQALINDDWNEIARLSKSKQ
ncbi:GIY-YIG nuclease family protein [Candidatus Colwellia aromaticivorans]|uniref:GIY-YIG nuclease family protein n=1 Tax=Candidatus Colwellia aromaticivorans TaxID=2267621 RepID=UPI000DF39D84|nr:GIY-YIG nuclease family protein [Candidatus Colwellia aromaticivorans]